jgi:lysophospholipase L1-like esterase
MYWYEDEVKRLEKDALKIGYEPETIFYGSSSIRMWKNLDTDFESIKPINLGFGGSTLAACTWFFERLTLPYHPKRLVVYAGDNDLGDGRHPEEVFIFFQQLMAAAGKRFSGIPCYFVSLKPSISRFNLIDQFKFANNLIETEIIKYSNNWKFIDISKGMVDAGGKPQRKFFMEDGLHLSPEGYSLWRQIINDAINVNG